MLVPNYQINPADSVSPHVCMEKSLPQSIVEIMQWPRQPDGLFAISNRALESRLGPFKITNSKFIRPSTAGHLH